MIESLKYVATFNSTGRTLKNQISFKPGITTIVGENESGKSFVLEMIRYALFGSDALRGSRSDYDKLDVTLVISIKNEKYTIVRSGNKATVNQNEAVGTTATNNYIKKKLGFGLEVFDIAHNANQGELDKLTKDLGPTERRRIVDEVTGLAQFEKAEKDCRDESNAFNKLVAALEAQLIEPVEPVMPEDYEPSLNLKIRLDAQIQAQALRGSLEVVENPVRPLTPDASEDDVEHEREREVWLLQRASLDQRLKALPENDSQYNREQLERFKLALAQEMRGPRPSDCSDEQLNEWREANLIRSREGEPLRCPECDTIVIGKELPPEPPMTNHQIDIEFAKRRAWHGFEYDESLEASPLSLREVDNLISVLESQPERELLLKQIEELGPEPEDRSSEARVWLNYKRDMARYDLHVSQYEAYLEKKKVIDSLPQEEPFLAEKYQLSLSYETLMARYEASCDIYRTQLAQLEGAKEKREAYKRGSLALKDARKEVKQYLVPSLSKVASTLLTEMTDGERRHIFIDENFDIWVDKQPVRTLSGSGVSVVNLALRVALGQVLTQSVIPIFLADEIDANMAEKRTKATHESLHRLKTKLKQIIVVTHKPFESDHKICLT